MIGPPVPWKKTAQTPNLGLWDATDDIRPGMGLAGADALRRFVERGGVLITEGSTSTFAATLGFNPTVQIAEHKTLRAQGSILRAQTSPRQARSSTATTTPRRSPSTSAETPSYPSSRATHSRSRQTSTPPCSARPRPAAPASSYATRRAPTHSSSPAS